MLMELPENKNNISYTIMCSDFSSWATSSSSASTDSRTYDEVPYESVQVCQVC